jgi:hypothetical protein
MEIEDLERMIQQQIDEGNRGIVIMLKRMHFETLIEIAKEAAQIHWRVAMLRLSPSINESLDEVSKQDIQDVIMSNYKLGLAIQAFREV